MIDLSILIDLSERAEWLRRHSDDNYSHLSNVEISCRVNVPEPYSGLERGKALGRLSEA